MSHLLPRIGEHLRDQPMLCDAWLEDGRRFGDRLPGVDTDTILGRWPDELEADAVVRLSKTVGEDADWGALAATPPVAQQLDERARPQPLDHEILRHLRHLQHVCHKPRLHLRVEEERLPVSRARRIPVRAVADLVSHPGDWEHRTLRSIQPARVLARQIEDEWNLYENRVAARLVDHLLAYLARRIEELRKIDDALTTGRDHSDQARTSFWRARRVMTLWADTLTSRTEDDLRQTMRRLELAQRDLQVLLGSKLYRNVPRRASVSLALKPTNILVNDPHYRKVAVLWRAWVKYGHRRHETQRQRTDRRQQEAMAWDRFVFHLVVRGFSDLGWYACEDGTGWIVEHPGYSDVRIEIDKLGVIHLIGERGELGLLPLCADLVTAGEQGIADQLLAWDELPGELVVVHVGKAARLEDRDRATGWSFGSRAALLACSPWGIDSQERMARLLHGWVNCTANYTYPPVRKLRGLPIIPSQWDWVRCRGEFLVVLRPPSAHELAAARQWVTAQTRVLEAKARQAKSARRAAPIAPLRAVSKFYEFIQEVCSELVGMVDCPVCGSLGRVKPRLGKSDDGSDSTWWATCMECDSEWGLRPCTICGSRFRALTPQKVGIDLPKAAMVAGLDEWPDKVLGRDVWAYPCRSGEGYLRCPRCAACSKRNCTSCPTPRR